MYELDLDGPSYRTLNPSPYGGISYPAMASYSNMGKVLLLGGITYMPKGAGWTTTDQAAVYDVATNTWSAAHTSSVGLSFGGTLLSLEPYQEDTVIAIGQSSGTDWRDTIWKFEPPDSWIAMPSMSRVTTGTRSSAILYNI